MDSGPGFWNHRARDSWAVAKLVRHLTLDQGIGGSSPPCPANANKTLRRMAPSAETRPQSPRNHGVPVRDVRASTPTWLLAFARHTHGAVLKPIERKTSRSLGHSQLGIMARELVLPAALHDIAYCNLSGGSMSFVNIFRQSAGSALLE